jgi:hypothetical protein
MSTNRKDKNAWRIPSMETYLTSIMIRKKKHYKILTQCIKEILLRSIAAGGTTLQDFSAVDGKPGYFSQTLSVYFTHFIFGNSYNRRLSVDFG